MLVNATFREGKVVKINHLCSLVSVPVEMVSQLTRGGLSTQFGRKYIENFTLD